ncbi:ABC transporter permease [Micrococcus sp. FDAARGOS_333]|uniref:ABC transporter permease n=1 Tax=Micrococcus sp. FDAARGOS_333 TaxID=1930558 RepID=UPI000B4E0EDB|nr:ABC transporter permease [Micrococcus sp. FDAARGOS_333]PNL17823.1 hypothetical protein CEQ11_006670 [Micrococcus sp. FDAARGOS_333]
MSTQRHDGRPASRTDEFRSAVHDAYGDASHLTSVTGRPGLGSYIRQLWQRRHFIWWQSRSRVVTSNDDSRLGAFWLILRPLLDATFYWLVFGVLLQFDRGMSNYVAFVIIGVFMFQFTGAALTGGTRTISSNMSLTRAFQFPRMALPIADLLFDVLQRMLAVGVMFVLVMVIPPHETPEWTWLLVPVVLALHILMNFGIMLLLARASTLFPDVSRLMQFVTRILMYGSGVIFPITRFTDRYPVLHDIIEMNPVFVVLTMYRDLIIDGVMPSAAHWTTLGACAVGLSVVGFFVFWLGEESYGRDQYR